MVAHVARAVGGRTPARRPSAALRPGETPRSVVACRMITGPPPAPNPAPGTARSTFHEAAGRPPRFCPRTLVYATCLFCKQPLGTNDAIETFPIGRRLAFDAARGRLWVVCPKCERWN